MFLFSSFPTTERNNINFYLKVKQNKMNFAWFSQKLLKAVYKTSYQLTKTAHFLLMFINLICFVYLATHFVQSISMQIGRNPFQFTPEPFFVTLPCICILARLQSWAKCPITRFEGFLKSKYNQM